MSSLAWVDRPMLGLESIEARVASHHEPPLAPREAVDPKLALQAAMGGPLARLHVRKLWWAIDCVQSKLECAAKVYTQKLQPSGLSIPTLLAPCVPHALCSALTSPLLVPSRESSWARSLRQPRSSRGTPRRSAASLSTTCTSATRSGRHPTRAGTTMSTRSGSAAGCEGRASARRSRSTASGPRHPAR